MPANPASHTPNCLEMSAPFPQICIATAACAGLSLVSDPGRNFLVRGGVLTLELCRSAPCVLMDHRVVAAMDAVLHVLYHEPARLHNLVWAPHFTFTNGPHKLHTCLALMQWLAETKGRAHIRFAATMDYWAQKCPGNVLFITHGDVRVKGELSRTASQAIVDMLRLSLSFVAMEASKEQSHARFFVACGALCNGILLPCLT